MNILLIYPGYPPENELGGGISTYAEEAARGLKNQNHSVTVISRSENTKFSSSTINGINIIRIPSSPSLSIFVKLFKFRKLGFIWFSYKVRKEIIKIEKGNKPFDIIEVGDWGAEAILFYGKFKEKLIVRCHTPSFISESYNPSNKPYLSKAIKLCEKIILSNVKTLCTPSKSLINEIRKYIKLKGKIIIEPYPFETKNFPFKKFYIKKFDKNNPMRIITVGRLEERKGQDIIVKALKLLLEKNYYLNLTCIGADTPLRDGKTFGGEIRNILTTKNQHCINFTGHIPKNEVPKHYISHDIFIIASRFESLGFVTLEAMRAQLPTIGSNICELPRIIQQGKAGGIFKSEDATDLAKQLEKFYLNPKLIRQIGCKNRKWILQEFGNEQPIKSMIKSYESIYKKNKK